MACYIKLYTDDKRRKKFNEKFLRHDRLMNYLDKVCVNPQIKRFKSYCQLTTASHSVYLNLQFQDIAFVSMLILVWFLE